MQKFTQKDVYYNNNFNVYVFDKEAVEKSKASNELVLKCIYKEFYNVGENMYDRWAIAFIKLSDLRFDTFNSNVCFNDSSEQKRDLQLKIALERSERLIAEANQRIDQDVEAVAKYFKEFYLHDQQPYNDLYFPLRGMETHREVAALDRKFKFATENSEVITKLFFDRRKPNFLSLLCDHGNIVVDTSKLIRNGVSVLAELLSLTDRDAFRYYITCLFRLGHNLTEKDRATLNALYEAHSKNISESEKEQIERWVIINLFSNVENTEYLRDVFKVEKLIFAIASMKYKLIVHSKFSQLIQVTHNFLQSHGEYGALFLRAMKAYGEYDKQINTDKSVKLKIKIDRFLNEKRAQNSKYNQIVFELFPEI